MSAYEYKGMKVEKKMIKVEVRIPYMEILLLGDLITNVQ